MANIANRSPWVVALPRSKPVEFRSRKQAQAHVEASGNSASKVYQLDNKFEVQILRSDAAGNEVRRSSTFDSRKEAERWARETEAELLAYRAKNGGFEASFETITIAQAFDRLHAEHYKGMASENEIRLRMAQMSEYFGSHTLLKNIKKKTLVDYEAWLTNEQQYQASSVRNYFAVLSVLYKRARKSWSFPVDNYAAEVELPKKSNAIQRNWEGDEQSRLFKAIEDRSPWLLPITRLALALSFRMGELVSSAKDRTSGAQSHGLLWEGVSFSRSEIRLFKEKNDHKKKATESLGRTVPMTQAARDILWPLYVEAKSKHHGSEPSGPVFSATRNSVSNAFRKSCVKAGITKFTFHTTRKIATYELSKQLPNPMQLSSITGHKDIATLMARYYKAPIDHLKDLLDAAPARKLMMHQDSDKKLSDEDILTTGLDTLNFVMGVEQTNRFLVLAASKIKT